VDQISTLIHAKRRDAVTEYEVGIELHHESIKLPVPFGLEFVALVPELENNVATCTKMHEERSIQVPGDDLYLPVTVSKGKFPGMKKMGVVRRTSY
jgi:hypothetical protein